MKLSGLGLEGQLSYDDDTSTRLRGVAHNITGQKRAEESSRLSEEKFRAFFENAGMGMAQVDSDLRFLMVNDRYCQITGYSREELLSMTPMDLDHPDEREADHEKLRRLFEVPGWVYDVEKRYVRKDGRVIWVHVTVTLVRDADGNPLQTAAVIEDITSRKEAENKLRESEERLRTVIENSRDGINMLDLVTGRYVLMSPTQVELTGFTAEILGQA